jgi:hypothetical protein
MAMAMGIKHELACHVFFMKNHPKVFNTSNQLRITTLHILTTNLVDKPTKKRLQPPIFLNLSETSKFFGTIPDD